MTYTPQPIDTTQIAVDPALEALIEKLARNVHDVWARQRMDEGWSWGPARDERQKQTPFLVDYDALPESEKDYDRRTALETLRFILALGYRIEPPECAGEAGDEAAGSALARRLESREALSLQELQTIWSGRDGALWPRRPELYRLLGERLVRMSEPLLAYDVLSEGLEALARAGHAAQHRRTRVRMRQLLGRALAQCNLPHRANEVFVELRAEGEHDGETLGMLARTWKDLGRRAEDPEAREEYYGQALAIYWQAYESATRTGDADGALYNGINAASLWLLCGRREEAAALARAVGKICREKLKGQPADEAADDYWVEATLGEAALILDCHAEAARHYARAAALAAHNLGDILSMRRQCRLLLETLTAEAGRFDHLFGLPRIALLAGGGGELDEAAEERFRQRLEEELPAGEQWIGYACPTTPAAIVFVEALRRRGREYHVVLPFHEEKVRRTALAWRNGAAWAARLEAALAGATTRRVLGDASEMDARTDLRFAAEYLAGMALLKKELLETELRTLEPPGPEGRKAPAGPPAPFPQAVRAMLFADVKGYSRLSERQLALFGHHYLGEIAATLEAHRGGLLSTRTAGDGLFCVFEGVGHAVAFALDLRDRLAGVAWQELGLPADLGIRISLDAGPVYCHQNPVLGERDFSGAYVIRAARIEPVTPPGHVYASEALAALAAARQAGGARLEYAGQVPLSKGYGVIPLYHVERVREEGGGV